MILAQKNFLSGVKNKKHNKAVNFQNTKVKYAACTNILMLPAWHFRLSQSTE